MTDVLSSSYLNFKSKTKANHTHDLYQRLKTLHNFLSELCQEDEDYNKKKKLKIIAGQLIAKKLLNHIDKNVRAIVCCCVVDILRIFVPESPFSAEELCKIFNTIAALFRGFETHITTIPDSHGAMLLYILKSLASVRSSVLMVYLTQQAVPGALDTLKEFFQSIISSVRPDHDEDVTCNMASILQACIEESFDTSSGVGQADCFDQDLLDSLLLPLLPQARQENPASYALCQTVISQESFLLQTPITKFANQVLVGTLTEDSHRRDNEAVDEEDSDSYGKNGAHLSSSSELSEHVYSLIYELHKIAPTLLLRILPNVCVQLQAEEVTTRIRAVKLLGRLFASPLANYAEEYKKNFKDFLGRFVDISIDVRKEMIECGFMILKHKHGVTTVVNEVEDCVCQRLRDAEWEVRYQALARLLDLIVEENGVSGPISEATVTSLLLANPESAHTSAVRRDRRGFTLREMAERMKDKRLQIRKVAMIGLAKVYWKHVALWLDPIDLPADSKKEKTKKKGSKAATEGEGVYEFGSGVPQEVWHRLKFIPGFILSCWGYPDPEERHLVLQLFQEQIIPKPPKKANHAGSSAVDKQGILFEKEECWLWERRRASALLTMYQSLDQQQRQCLSNILASKAKTRLELATFLSKWTQQLQQPSLSGGKKRTAAANPVLHRASIRMLAHFPPTGGSHTSNKSETRCALSLEDIFASKDKSIRRLMLQAIDSRLPIPPARLSNVHNSLAYSAEITRACSSRDDLKSRLDSKSSLAKYVGCLYDSAASFMLISPLTVEIILRYVSNLCRQLSTCENFIFSHRGQSNAVRDAKFRQTQLQTKVETVCRLLVMMGKHSPRSFADVAGFLEEWIASICDGPQDVGKPSLWRDATLSFYIQLVKFIKVHLYCADVEDALDLQVRHVSGKLDNENEDDVLNASRRARSSSLARLCSRSLRYAIYIGEGQADGNDQIEVFLQQLAEKKKEDVNALVTNGDENDSGSDSSDMESLSVGVFNNSSLAASLIAESVAAIIEGGSVEERDNLADTTSQLSDVTIIRRRALCEILGVSTTIRYLLLSISSSASFSTKNASMKLKKNISPSCARFLYGDVDTLSFESLSCRLCIVAALLEYFEDESSVDFANIMTSGKTKSGSRDTQSRKYESVLAMSVSIVQSDLLGCATGHPCCEFPDLSPEKVSTYCPQKMNAKEKRSMSLFQRCNDREETNNCNGYVHSLAGALKVYTAVIMNIEQIHCRSSYAMQSHGKSRKRDFASSPFRERLEEEYEMTIEEDYDEKTAKPSLSDRFPSYLVDLLTYLFSIIRSRGTYIDGKRSAFNGSTELENDGAVFLRETAGKCLLKLLTLKRVNKYMISKEWLNVGLLFVDSNIGCRENILSELCSLMQTHCLHPRCLALPCLALYPISNDDSCTATLIKMSTMIQNSLLFALRRLRCTHESLCAQAMSISAAMDDPDIDEGNAVELAIQSKKLQRTAEDNIPQGIFPYVLFLLSRPPVFPTKADVAMDTSRKADYCYKSLRMVVNVLVKSLPNNSGDNIALLLKQVDVIARFYQDRLVAEQADFSNEMQGERGASFNIAESYDRLQVITQVAQHVLTSFIKTQENIQPYLGDVNLPMDLYELKPKTSSRTDLNNTSRIYFEHILSTGQSQMTIAPTAKSKKRQAGLDKNKSEEVDSTQKRTNTKISVKSSKVESVQSKSKIGRKSKKQKTENVNSRTSGSRRRGGVPVNYKDTRDSEDEEEMEEIEDLLSTQSQSQSRRSSSSSSASSTVTTTIPLYRQSVGSPIFANRRISGDSTTVLEDDVDLDVVTVQVSSSKRGSSLSSKGSRSSGRHGGVNVYGSDDDSEMETEDSPPSKKLKSKRASKEKNALQNKSGKRIKTSKAKK